MRPITIQPVLLKLLEKCLQLQLSPFIQKEKILTSAQFGFRQGHSTSHALLAITDHIRTNVGEGKICIFLALDCAKAFDKLDRNILFQKLKYYNIDTKLLESLLSDRGQYVERRVHA